MQGPSVLVLVGMKGCLSVQKLLASQEKGPNWLLHKYPDCLYGKYASDAEPEGDVFYFDYGCVAFWGLKVKQVHPMLALPDGHKPAVQQPLGQLSRLGPPLPASHHLGTWTWTHTGHSLYAADVGCPATAPHSRGGRAPSLTARPAMCTGRHGAWGRRSIHAPPNQRWCCRSRGCWQSPSSTAP